MATRSKSTQSQILVQRFVQFIKKRSSALKKAVIVFMARRPHRSFRLTRRRDYNRSLKLPGYIAFTHEVNVMLKTHRKLFLLLALVYAVLSMSIVGLASQDTYDSLSSALRDTGAQIYGGDWGQLSQAGLILATIATNGLSQGFTDAQQIYTFILGLLVWLTAVWLLRNLIAGHRVRLRDGLYNAGAPIISTFFVCVVLAVQLIPVALAILGYTAALSSGLLKGGVEAMLFWAAALLLVVISLYWITSTFFALVIVTLPGMYPLKALRAAGDLVVGRRLRILGRMLWMGLCIVIGWVVVMIPVILLDSWIKSLWSQVQWLPIVPVFLVIITTLTLIWGATYIYLFYRKVVADDAKPA